MVPIDNLLSRLASHAASGTGDPFLDWEATSYDDFAHVQAATMQEFASSAEAFSAAEALVATLRADEYIFHNFERLRAERNDVTTGNNRWRGFVEFGVVSARG